MATGGARPTPGRLTKAAPATSGDTAVAPAAATAPDGPGPCPRCGQPLRGGGGWVTWCPACDHGVVNQKPPEVSRRQQRQDERRRRTDDALAAEIAAGTAGPGLGSSALVAAGIHLVTLACLLAGVWLAVITWFNGITVLAILLALIGVVVRPRVPRVKHGTPAAEVPALAAYVGAIAERIGCPPPEAYAADDSFNASVQRALGPRFRPTTVVTIGRMLWAGLTEQERVALIGHELGHAVAGDPSRSWFVWSARSSLREWEYLFDAKAAPRRRVRRGGSMVALESVAAWLVPFLLLPIWLAIRGLSTAYGRTVLRASRRMEMLADRAAAEAAGTAAVRRLLSTLSLGDVARVAVSSARARGETTPATQLVRAAIARVPESERERQVRRERAIGDTGDQTHPPHFRRIALVEAMPAVADRPVVADLAAVDAEVARL